MAGKQNRSRRGSAPARNPNPRPVATIAQGAGYPLLCLRHCQSGWGIEQLSAEQCREFLVKWEKRAKLTWTELVQHSRHGLGSEQLPKRVFKTAVPEHLEQDRYTVFRHEGNLPFVGFRAGDVFHVLWFESRYNDLYDH